MKTFLYRGSDGEVKGMVLGAEMRRGMGDIMRALREEDDENTIWILDETGRIIAIFTPDEGEFFEEKVPEPVLAGTI